MDIQPTFLYNAVMFRLVTTMILMFTFSCTSHSLLMPHSDIDATASEFPEPDIPLGMDADIDIHHADVSVDQYNDNDVIKTRDLDTAQGDETGTFDSTGDVTYTGVYAGLEDLQGDALRARLYAIVTTGYHSISYDEASYQLKHYVDNYNGYVTGVYTGQKVPVSQAGSAFNVEHTWPQSKGAKGEAKSDLHHLYPTNSRANSARGNYPFGIVTDEKQDFGVNPHCTDHFPGHPEGCLSYLGYDSSGAWVFEPRDAHKGNAARAVLYFALRYKKDLRVFDSRHPKITEKTLKEWNHEDPPDANERTRNSRIQKLQNNRNPFIDHPEFIDRIEFVQ